MTVETFNLLTAPLIQTIPGGAVSLPGLLAGLARDEIDSLPALRPHQGPALHMFITQLAALALHRAGRTELPADEAAWRTLLRGLTSDDPDDAPWCLVVEDWTKPAFLQPPVPDGVALTNPVPTADALDLLITSRNHDAKQAVARDGAADDWIFALISLQTGEGYGGAGNHGIARMNGGSSSRPSLTLAPLPPGGGRRQSPRLGARWRRDVRRLLATRDVELAWWSDLLGFPAVGGLALIWLAPWPEGQQLRLDRLDIWFIEVCRRVRLAMRDGRLIGWKSTSKATRIDAKHQNGAVGDPFAPTHKTEGKSLTLGGREFDYRLLTDLLLSGDWRLPVLAQPGDDETGPMAVVAEALARGNSKTEGFKSRILPLGGRKPKAVFAAAGRAALHALAQAQMQEIDALDKILAGALALKAAGGDWEKRGKPHYAHALPARTRLTRAADALFFPHLWARFDAQEQDEAALTAAREAFRADLARQAAGIFETFLPAMPCPAVFRHRADARARSAFHGQLRGYAPALLPSRPTEEADHAIA